MDERIDNARRVYERAVLEGDARRARPRPAGTWTACEADLPWPAAGSLHTRFLHQRDADPGAGPRGPGASCALFDRAARALPGRSTTYAGEAETQFWVGCFYRWSGGTTTRRCRCLRRSLELATQAGDKNTMSEALRHLGIAAHAAGDMDEARERLEESTRLRRELGQPAGIAANLVGLGLHRRGPGAPRRRARHPRGGRWPGHRQRRAPDPALGRGGQAAMAADPARRCLDALIPGRPAVAGRARSSASRYPASPPGRLPLRGGACYAAGPATRRGLLRGGACRAACYAAGPATRRGLLRGGAWYAAGPSGGPLRGGACYAAGPDSGAPRCWPSSSSPGRGSVLVSRIGTSGATAAVTAASGSGPAASR